MKNKLLAKSLGILLVAGMLFTGGCSGKEKQEADTTVKQEEAAEPEKVTEEEGTPKEDNSQTDAQPEEEDVQEEKTEPEEEESEQEKDEESAQEAAEEFAKAKTRYYYAELLSRLYFTGYISEEEQVETDLGNMSDNKYAVLDIDGDGREELLVSISNASMAGMFESVYDYNSQSGEWNQQLVEFPSLTYYDNGTAKAEWSHNQGLGESLWPFTLYRYDAQSDAYQEVGSVDTWEKSYREQDYEGNSFPDELDTDQDGILYYIYQPGGQANETPVNKSEYEQWLGSYVGNAQPVEVPYQNMEVDNFSVYTKDYLTLVRKQNLESVPGEDEIGLYFMENDSDIEEVERMLVSKCSLEVSESDELEHRGVRDGKEVFSFYYEDGGSFTYQNEKVEGLTMFGVYPGMEEQEAVSSLEKYGFHADEGGSYVTGDGWGNYAVWLNCENGVVTGISVGSYCRYVS